MRAGTGTAAGLLLLSLALGGCSQHAPAQRGGAAPEKLLLVSYAVTKRPFERILPKFEADWKARTGRTIAVKTSYGGSGAQTRAIIDGLDADVATLALAGDVLKLQKAHLVQAGWEKELLHDAVITNSVVAFVTRPGHGKGLRSWSDLARPGIAVITANPRTSGGARWNFLGLWGSVIQRGGSEAQARDFVRSVYRRVENLPKDAREASDVFLKRGQGDVLLNYENEAILATRAGLLKGPFLVPAVNIRIEGPVVVVDRNVDRKGTRKAAEALAAYLQSEPAQQIFAEEGFRPVNARVWARVRDRFAPVETLFSAADFGGWKTINATFFSDGGLWDQLFRETR